MKVSLIQPKMQRRPVDTSLKARMSPHLGLLTIAGLVRRAGHEVSVQNGNLKPVEIPVDADLVGITVTVDVLPQAIELAKLCREKRIPVVAGGIGIASDPDTARPHFDAICIGPAEGVALADVKRIAVNGPAGSVAVIADLGIAPAVAGTVDATGTLNVTYSMPTMSITAFDPQTGVVKIKVVPGTGNKIVSELATGYVHACGTSNLVEKMKCISKVGFDLTPYLKPDTKGEAVLQVELGTHSFLKIKVEETPKTEGMTK